MAFEGDDFRATVALLDEALSLFEIDEEENLVRNIHTLGQETASLFQKKQENLKETIRELTSRVKSAEEEASRKEPETAHRQRMEQIDSEKQKTVQNIQDMKTECIKLESAIEKLNLEQENLKKTKQQIDKETIIDVPRVKDALTLYASISNIRWDYDTDTVKGYASVVESKHPKVRPFNLDPTKHSKFYITNYLWDLMEAEMK